MHVYLYVHNYNYCITRNNIYVEFIKFVFGKVFLEDLAFSNRIDSQVEGRYMCMCITQAYLILVVPHLST